MHDQLINYLDKLVRVESVYSEAITGCPFGEGSRRVLDVMADILRDIGLKPHITGDAVVYADWLPACCVGDSRVDGDGSGYFACVGHLDVVEAGKDWKTDPFKLTHIYDKYFGRGVLDNKGPAASVVCALSHLIKKYEYPKKPFRIIFGSCEENKSLDIPIYLEDQKPPIFAFTPDCKFPVVYSEKGILAFDMEYEIFPLDGELEGTKALFDIPPDQFSKARIPDRACVFIDGHEFYATGKSAHTAKPELADNAITKLATKIVNTLKSENKYGTDPSKVHLLEYFKWLASFYDDFHGKFFEFEKAIDELKLDKNTENICKQITVVPFSIDMADNKIITHFTMRYPGGVPDSAIKNALTLKGAILGSESKPAYMDPANNYVGVLSKAYADITGNYLEPVETSGGTYARVMPNTVAFGPSFPGSPHGDGVAHNANEYMEENELFLLLKIYARAIELLVC